MEFGEILQPEECSRDVRHFDTDDAKDRRKRANRGLQGRSTDKVVRISIKVHDQAAEAR